MKRRTFLKKSSVVTTGSILAPSIISLHNTKSANEKINIAVVGCNSMGWSDVNSCLKMDDVDLVGICDVDGRVIEKRLVDYKKLRSNKPKIYNDYRKMLLDETIDAVIIGTPDHWHCKIMVDAVKAGKHIYTEKPIANTVEECNIMVKAAQQYKKVVQVGQWQRSGDHYKKAIAIVNSGVLGNIRLVKVWAYQGWMGNLNNHPDSQAPKEVDYKMWLGPAPTRNFNKNRFHFDFRWYWDYAGGLMTDWGVHELDIALYAMGAEAPKSVLASGGKFAYPNDPSETPDTLQAVYEYDGFNMLWEHAAGIDYGPYNLREGIAFIGNNGTLVVNRDGYKVMVEKESLGYSEEGKAMMETIASYKKPSQLNYLDLHTQNFITAVKQNDHKLLNTPIESGSVAAINAQMGNIAYKTGAKLNWDANMGGFKNHAEANKLLKANYHNGWKIPRV